MNETYLGWYVVLVKGDATATDYATFLAIAKTERSAKQQVSRLGYRRKDGWRVDRIGLVTYAYAWQIHQ